MARRDESKRKSSGPSNREELKARRLREERQKLIPIILIVVAAVAVVAILISSNLTPKSVSSRPQAQGLAMGDSNAPVKVEEFADFQCPACGIFSTDLEPKIVSDYVTPGKVYFKYSPFAFLGPESNTAAEAAYCASDQGKFWEYQDTLYNNQSGENKGWFTNARMTTFATNLALNVDDFKKCLEGGKYKQQVLDDLEYGKKNNIDRTPSFLVNGKLVYADGLDAAIKTALAAKGIK
jgi:protein-disulfide isomerase